MGGRHRKGPEGERGAQNVGDGMRETGRNIIKFNVLVYGPRSWL